MDSGIDKKIDEFPTQNSEQVNMEDTMFDETPKQEENKEMEDVDNRTSCNKRISPPSPAYFTPSAPVTQDSKKVNTNPSPALTTNASKELPSASISSQPHTILVHTTGSPNPVTNNNTTSLGLSEDSNHDSISMSENEESKEIEEGTAGISLSDADLKAQTGGRWSPEEDEILRKTVMDLGAKNWKKISSVAFQGKRSDVQCLHRWQKVLRPGLVKGSWTKQEDDIVLSMIRKHGFGNIKWSAIAAQLPGRLGKQCRERWFNHLDPDLKKEPWSVEEDKILMEAQATMGNRWCQIAQLLPGRSENAVKNRWNSAMRRKFQVAKEKDRGEGKSPKPKKERKKKEPKESSASTASSVALSNNIAANLPISSVNAPPMSHVAMDHSTVSMESHMKMDQFPGIPQDMYHHLQDGGHSFMKHPMTMDNMYGMPQPLSPSLAAVEPERVEISKITGKPKRKYKKRAPKNPPPEQQHLQLQDHHEQQQQEQAVEDSDQSLLNELFGYEHMEKPKAKPRGRGRGKAKNADPNAPPKPKGSYKARNKTASAVDVFWPDLAGNSGFGNGLLDFGTNSYFPEQSSGNNGINMRSGNYGILNETTRPKGKQSSQDSLANFDFFSNNGPDLLFSSAQSKQGGVDPAATLHGDDGTGGLFEDLNFLNLPIDYDGRFDSSLSGSLLGPSSAHGALSARDQDDPVGSAMFDQLCDDFFPADIMNMKAF